jgi:hypothetical protein
VAGLSREKVAGPPNVSTPFGLLPQLSQVVDALKLLPSQTELGITDFVKDLSDLSLSSQSEPSLLGGSSGTASRLSDAGLRWRRWPLIPDR